MSTKPLTGLEKAAVLLKSLPFAVVDKVLSHMDPRLATRLRSELTEVSKRPDLSDAVARVLDEAAQVLAAKKGDASKPRTPAGAAQERGAQIDVKVGGAEEKPSQASAPVDNDPLRCLTSIKPETLALALEGETARTIALLMNRLDVEFAGKIYKRLTPFKRREVSLKFTEQAKVGDDLLARIAQALVVKCQGLADAPTGGPDQQGEREKRMADLLRNLERAERIDMLKALEESDAALTGRLKAMLYQFEDIELMENSSIQKLLAEIDMKTLAMALRGAPTEIQDRITANLSRRAQESLKEEIELAGNVPGAKVKQARQGIEEAIQRLDEREELIMIETE